MKETKKIPLWPLYLADAMMFATVFIIALPSIRYSESMSVGQTLLCCIMVLAAMALMLVPYWLEGKAPARAEKGAEEEDASENFKIIFDELSALRLMIAEGEERMDEISEKIDTANNDVKFEAFETAMTDFRDSLKTKLREINESIDSNAMALSACESADKDIKAEISKIAAEVGAVKAEIEKTATDFENRLEMLLEHHDIDDDSDSQKFKSQPKFGEMLTKALSGSETAKTAVRKFVSMNKNFDTVISEDGNVLGKDAPTASSDIPGRSHNVEMPDDAHLVNECLPESQSEFDPCRKENSEEHLNKDVETVISEDGDEIGKENFEAPNIIPGEKGQVEIPDAEDEQSDEEFGGAIDEITAEAAKKDKNGEDEDPDFFESADSGLNISESAAHTEKVEPSETAGKSIAEKVKEILPDAQSTFLLDNVPESKIKKPEKKDAVITVNALIGIGNKPYLRGNGAGLSPDKGTPMEFVEIGRWRYLMPGLSEPVTFTVLKNDEEAAEDETSFTIKAGEKLELNLSFPIG